MRISILVAVFALALGCESRPSNREISKEVQMTDMRTGETQTCVDGDQGRLRSREGQVDG